ncbi:MAG: threonine ammonia-lyase, biosynthetic [Acidimicrobiia bacterium]|nr:threonine ammonia-lyase, biosynthetic [Acidimicrobiia bacterium]
MDYRSADLAARIEEANIYAVATRTSLHRAPMLSDRLSNRILLKREDQQPTFSFKVRGAANKIQRLPESEVIRGVICSSAGNHAQGVALAAARRGIPAHIVMPETSAEIKVRAVEALGGRVQLVGDSYDDAQRVAYERSEAEGLCFVHPFDDLDVIAGQGTIGREILDQGPDDIAAVFVPVGGGGLAAGIATYLKVRRPGVRVYGVEPADAASMQAALKSGGPITLEHVGTFADGVAVKRVGDTTFELCRQHLDGVITVSTDELCAGIRDIFDDTRTLVEPAGALAVAGIRRYVEETGAEGENLVAINCGANMNFNRLGHVAERTAVGDKREALLAVGIPERRGSFLQFCRAIGSRHVTEFNYRRYDARQARIFVGLELLPGAADRHSLIDHLEEVGYSVTDLTDNELAKLHVRHLAGGPSSDVNHERLLRFEFPERRGALLRFLESVGIDWNITLFHYRNHGSDYGRVLVAVEVPPETSDEFDRHLEDLGYRFWDETDNEAYALFLRGA